MGLDGTSGRGHWCWFLASAPQEAAGKSGVPNCFLKPENVFLLVE